jgi:hypothetical protein
VLLEGAEEKMRRIRGDEHPCTRVVTRNLAKFRAKMTGITVQNADSWHSTERKKGHSLYARIRRKLRKRDNAE